VGKSVGKDANAGKATWVSILGVAGAREKLLELERAAIVALAPFEGDAAILSRAAEFVTRRRN